MEPQPRPENVLLVLVDDLRADAPGTHTLNLNALAAEGLRYTNAFVVSSVPMTAVRTTTTKVVTYGDGTVHRFDLVADPQERSPEVSTGG